MILSSTFLNFYPSNGTIFELWTVISLLFQGVVTKSHYPLSIWPLVTVGMSSLSFFCSFKLESKYCHNFH